ncbi:type II toxin-antitoxin system RelE/ParE family toxin [Providencia rettgeri]|uniref:type II toxin-antitoxin system RelE/ParE family toxin n=1 Tax=Providencia rettgeri TaxID=587 RepID=UPI00141A142F|nr:type II toxin-antitoxin system RelE/ParE family toxin [Providencia rettgeri]NIH07025.1 type II toxin-antitoxin system RelE/ParE family toxin [Providencia rettgeri]
MELMWTSKALSDLSRVYDFLAFSNPAAAARVVQTLTQAPITLLAKNPRMGEQLFQFMPHEVRRMVVTDYEIRYEIIDSAIYILRIWHTREDR